MKTKAIALFLLGFIPAFAQDIPTSKTEQNMDRIERCKKNYTELFGGEALTGQGTDPEMMDILQKFIFGEVFRTGDLDKKTRELITCTVLATMQTLPQLNAHAKAALNVGVTPIELREAIYLCAPFIGFPKTLNALNTINEVFKQQGIASPLERQATVTEEDRHEKGQAIQSRLYLPTDEYEALRRGNQRGHEERPGKYGSGSRAIPHRILLRRYLYSQRARPENPGVTGLLHTNDP